MVTELRTDHLSTWETRRGRWKADHSTGNSFNMAESPASGYQLPSRGTPVPGRTVFLVPPDSGAWNPSPVEGDPRIFLLDLTIFFGL